MPLTSNGLLSAQTARSIPASAIARACATRIWLLAILGSLAESTEKPTTSTVMTISASMARGSATPRWSFRMSTRCRGVISVSSDAHVPKPDHGLHGGELIAVVGQRLILAPGLNPHFDARDQGGIRRRGAGIGRAVIGRVIGEGQRLDPPHEGDGPVDRVGPVERRAGDVVADAIAVLVHEGEVQRHAGVLLGLHTVRAVEIDLLALKLQREDARHDHADDGRDYQELGQRESPLIAERPQHGLHLCVMYMVTTADLVVPDAACPTPVIGVYVTVTVTWRMVASTMPLHPPPVLQSRTRTVLE